MASNTDVRVLGTVSSALPTKVADNTGSPSPQRLGAYQETVVSYGPELQASEEGALYVVTNPTPGTTIQVNAGGAGQAFADATNAAIVVITNNNAVGGASIRPKSFKLILTGTAPATTVSMEFAHKIQAATRGAISSNVALIPKNVNGNRTSASGAVFNFATTGLITMANAADANARLVGRSHISTGLGITGDEYVLKYGDDDSAGSTAGLTATRATAPGRFVSDAPAIVIPPGWTYSLHFWWLTQTTNALFSEFEFKFLEK